jgi:hypothetical protein
MYDTRSFSVRVGYLGVEGPCVVHVSVQATTKYHAIELAYTQMQHIQPNRQHYEIAYTAKKTHKELQMKRTQQLLAGYAECYAWTYN